MMLGQRWIVLESPELPPESVVPSSAEQHVTRLCLDLLISDCEKGSSLANDE